MNKRYIITLWKNIFDYDGLTSDFMIFDNNYYDLGSVKKIIDSKILKVKNDELKIKNKGWGIMEIEDYKKRPPIADVNENNKIVYSNQIKVGDGSGYNSIYYYFDVLQINNDEKLKPELFNIKNCELEIKSFFNK